MVKAGARIPPYSVIGRQTHVEEGAVVDARSSGRTAGSARRRSATPHPRPQLSRRPQRHDRNRRCSSATRRSITDYSRSDRPLLTDQHADFQGLRHPRPVSRRSQRGGRAPDRPRLRGVPEGQADRRRRATCACRRRRWPRRSSTARAQQGADVVDYGMMATDMLYFAVARDGTMAACRSPRRTIPKQYNGIKWFGARRFR